jgi:DNA polymerase III gamma/tau subunit
VTSVAKREGVALEAGVADLVATLGDGSFRDTLGTLQKVLSAVTEGKKGTKVSLADVELVTGAPKSTVVNSFLSALVRGDAPAALEAITVADKAGVDMKFFIALILEKARHILLLKISKGGVQGIADLFSAEDATFLQSLASVPVPESRLNATALALLLRAYDETSRAYIPTLPLELAVIEIVKEK